jgi:hypothetical protein
MLFYLNSKPRSPPIEPLRVFYLESILLELSIIIYFSSISPKPNCEVLRLTVLRKWGSMTLSFKDLACLTLMERVT